MHCSADGEECDVSVQGLAALRDRLSMVVTGRASKTSQLEESLKVTLISLPGYARHCYCH